MWWEPGGHGDPRVILNPGHLSSPGSPVSSWVTGCASEHQLAGLGPQRWPGLGLGEVPCTRARPAVFAMPYSMAAQGSFCLSPSVLSLLGQRQQLSTAASWLCLGSGHLGTWRSPMI